MRAKRIAQICLVAGILTSSGMFAHGMTGAALLALFAGFYVYCAIVGLGVDE